METTQQEVGVEEAALAVLANRAIRDLRHLRVDRHANQLELRGEVRSYYHKQMAQEAVRNVASGMQVVNRIEVSA